MNKECLSLKCIVKVVYCGTKLRHVDKSNIDRVDRWTRLNIYGIIYN